MSTKKPDDDVAFDEHGQPYAVGPEAAAGEQRIIEHPESTPVLIVAELHGELGVRVFGKPSMKVADLLDHIAATYRAAVTLATSRPQ